MNTDGDSELARLLYSLVGDLLTWLDDCPGDEVDPNAVAAFRQGIDWVVERLPAERRERLASGDPGSAALPTVTGLFVDVMWWLGTCEDDEVDLHVATKLLESGAACVVDLSDEQCQRLLEIVDELAAMEPHDGRRYELRIFPFEMGFVMTNPMLRSHPSVSGSRLNPGSPVRRGRVNMPVSRG